MPEIFQIKETLFDDELGSQPEHAMGFQWVSMNGSLAVAIGGYVVVTVSAAAVSEIEALLALPWMMPSSRLTLPRRQSGFDTWRRHLPPATNVSLIHISRFMIGQNMAVNPPAGPLLPPPAAPSPLFGHLPLTATTNPGDQIHRFEAFPRSRRINVAASTVSAGTFAVPPSELGFLPTGLSVVGRLALPNLLPASFGWDLEPPLSTTLRCGASVPLFGQAGGGVEVEIQVTTKMVAITPRSPLPTI